MRIPKKSIRKIMKSFARIFGLFATFPSRFWPNEISAPLLVSHDKWLDYLSKEYNKDGMRVLEIGSRVVTGADNRPMFDKAEYIGFDFYGGDNVDVVGDAHRLSSYFAEGEKFDLIFSSAVFEHLCMPWVVAQEINKLLKIGGCVFVETHFSYSSHERPWHFFQFSDMGLKALFSPAMGFEVIDSGMSNPISGYFSHNADSYLRYKVVIELYCHSEILAKKSCDTFDINWRQIDLESVVNNTSYPIPKK